MVLQMSRNNVFRSAFTIATVVFALGLQGCQEDTRHSGSTSAEQAPTGIAQKPAEQPKSDRYHQYRTASVANLSWDAPAARVNGDGLAMGELAGYVIYYGQDPDNLEKSVEITEASTMEYAFRDLTEGTWYFAVTVRDVDGLVSEQSTVVSKTI